MSKPTVPLVLYHYTSILGVEGILIQKAVWASLLHFMNDSQEWLYALDLVKLALRRRITFREDTHWLTFIADLTDSLSRIENLNICVFSLTEMPNQLSQWRAYCPAEGGYNLQFRFDVLRQHLERHGFQLKQCIYDLTLQIEMVEEIVTNVLSSVGKLDDENAIQIAKELAIDRFIRELTPVAPILKHYDFREEHEWRAFSLVLSDDPRMDYHVKGSIAIPHCVLDLTGSSGAFPIGQVTVGPNGHQKLAQRGIAALSFRARLKINVQPSSTPLRNI